jgi:hypothetical protein
VFAGFAGAQVYGPRWHETPAEVRGRVMIGTGPCVISGRSSCFFVKAFAEAADGTGWAKAPECCCWRGAPTRSSADTPSSR